MKKIFLKKWGSNPQVELSLVFVSDQAIQKLNLKYRKRNKVTDVLSFPMDETGMVGDIVIAPSKAHGDAKKEGVPFEYKLKFLLIHGFLHLLGYDHEISHKEELRMQRKEREYMKMIS